MEFDPLQRRVRCDHVRGPVRLEADQARCAEVHGCQGIDCPHHGRFAHAADGADAEHRIQGGFVPLFPAF